MTWVRIDDRFDEHPKVMAAGPLGGFLFIRGLCYCARNLTDGFIPEAIVARLTADIEPNPGMMADLMVQAGLWERRDGGFSVHDYLDFNPAKEEVLAEREATAERVRRFRNGQRNAVTNAVRNGSPFPPLKDPPSTPYPDPVPDPVPVTTTTTPPSPPAGGERPRRARRTPSSDDPAFEAFWTAYPETRRRGKHEAYTAWRTLRLTAAQIAQVMVSLAAWKRTHDWLKDDGKYIPWPQKFLNRRRWQETVEDRPIFRAERV